MARGVADLQRRIEALERYSEIRADFAPAPSAAPAAPAIRPGGASGAEETSRAVSSQSPATPAATKESDMPETVVTAPAQPDAESIRAEATKVLESFGPPRNAQGGYGGHVFNLGHGISQHTPPEHVTALVEAVHSHSRELRK